LRIKGISSVLLAKKNSDNVKSKEQLYQANHIFLLGVVPIKHQSLIYLFIINW